MPYPVTWLAAMVMPFAVREPGVLKILQPGTPVRFTMVEDGDAAYADHLKTVKVTNYESEPTEAGAFDVYAPGAEPGGSGQDSHRGGSQSRTSL